MRYSCSTAVTLLRNEEKKHCRRSSRSSCPCIVGSSGGDMGGEAGKGGEGERKRGRERKKGSAKMK